MKETNNMTSCIIVFGVIILFVFTTVLAINLLPSYESNSYYSKVDNEMIAKIESVNIQNNQLNITTSGDATKYCAKSTRSIPKLNSICWKELENNKASISVYKYKKYYVWIRDTRGNISDPVSINSQNE